MAEPLKILVLGAHPDDAEASVGGLLCRYREQGHAVKIISLTRGDAGHHLLGREELAARRLREGRAAAALIGASFEAWDHRDGELLPTLELRAQVIAELRRSEPDLVLTHRLQDYHPDHRATARAVQDAAYLVSVPAVVPEVPLPSRPAVIAYMPDLFTRPLPLEPHVVIDVTRWVNRAVAMLACHESQVFEWLPHNLGWSGRGRSTHEGMQRTGKPAVDPPGGGAGGGAGDDGGGPNVSGLASPGIEEVLVDGMPESPRERLKILRGWFLENRAPYLERYAEAVRRDLGEDALTREAGRVEVIEVLEISEYSASVTAAGNLDAEERARLFPFDD